MRNLYNLCQPLIHFPPVPQPPEIFLDKAGVHGYFVQAFLNPAEPFRQSDLSYPSPANNPENSRQRKQNTIGNDMEQKYGNTEITAIENEKYKLPKLQNDDTIMERTFIVTRRDTDNNGHTNNVKYIEWAIDDIPDDIYNTMTISDIRVVYRKECYKGDAVTSKCCVHTLENGIKEVISFFEDGAGEGILFAEVVTQWKNNVVL